MESTITSIKYCYSSLFLLSPHLLWRIHLWTLKKTFITAASLEVKVKEMFLFSFTIHSNYSYNPSFLRMKSSKKLPIYSTNNMCFRKTLGIEFPFLGQLSLWNSTEISKRTSKELHPTSWQEETYWSNWTSR